MVFSSYLFIFFFLPLALLGYYAAPKKLRHLTLTIFSYIFYGWANPWFCLLMLIIHAFFLAGAKKDGELLDFSILFVYINLLSLVPLPAESGFKALFIGIFSKRTHKPAKFKTSLLLKNYAEYSSRDHYAFVSCWASLFAFLEQILGGTYMRSHMGIRPAFLCLDEPRV